MADNIDIDVSKVIDHGEGTGAAMATGRLIEAADRIFNRLLSVCSGAPTVAERLGHREFAIYRRNPTI